MTDQTEDITPDDELTPEELSARREREKEAELQAYGLAIVSEKAGGPTGEHIEIRVKHHDSGEEFDALGDTRVNALTSVLMSATSRGIERTVEPQ